MVLVAVLAVVLVNAIFVTNADTIAPPAGEYPVSRVLITKAETPFQKMSVTSITLVVNHQERVIRVPSGQVIITTASESETPRQVFREDGVVELRLPPSFVLASEDTRFRQRVLFVVVIMVTVFIAMVVEGLKANPKII